ncbi:hypothetical protein [Achromobacter sp. UMC71]|uniref:hypothetical protein n=1 Tax=Achromobacter sp. UMC71 TaxID=1862320 RepID=UPI0021076274|nr:hypothetical protein [Achromobacter sp. UMC71]
MMAIKTETLPAAAFKNAATGRALARAIRLAAGAVALAGLSACGVSTVDELRVTWPDFKQGAPLVLPSDPAQCPDLAGTYRAAGERRAGDAPVDGLDDLQRFLANTLTLPGLRDTAERQWQPTANATVTFNAATGGWRIQADDGKGGGSAAWLGQRDGAVDPDPVDPAQPPSFGVVRYTGCTQGRFWVTARRDWHQYESMGVYRYVAVLRPQAGGLLVSVQRESHSIGLLPWYSSDTSQAQYWFAPAAAK